MYSKSKSGIMEKLSGNTDRLYYITIIIEYIDRIKLSSNPFKIFPLCPPRCLHNIFFFISISINLHLYLYYCFSNITYQSQIIKKHTLPY